MDHLSEVVDSRLKILLSDYYEFEQLLKKLPSEMSEEMKNSVSALEEALKVAPEFFDQNFKDTMNQAMELAKNIENQVQEFNELVKDQQLNLNQHANTISELHKRELEAMQSKYERSMRVFNEEATARGEKAMKNSEIACNNVIQKFEDNCVVPALWVWVLPLGGGIVSGIVSAMFVLFMLIITKLLPF
ncbi:TPA: hypothetical protein ACVU5Q_003711 [Vibrio parahaemolyticus]